MATTNPERVGFSSSRLARIGPAMRRFSDQGLFAGAVTLIARHGELVHLEAHGQADLTAGRPLAADAIFRIFSMTKPITAAAVLLLHEEGHFLLDDPIAAYIPEFAATKVFVRDGADGPELADLERPISIRHLLMHTSGLTYGLLGESTVDRLYGAAQIHRPDELLAEKVARLAGLPLVHQPGAGWTYGFSTDVLGRLVEVVSGQTLDVFLQRRLFGPLEMADTGFAVPPAQRHRAAPLHTPDDAGGLRLLDDSGLPVGRAEPPGFLSGGGGLHSTATDYARFAQMLLGGGRLGPSSGWRLLSRKTVELLSTSQMTREQIPFVPKEWPFRAGYGMALGVRTLVDVARSGAPGSAGTYTWQGAASTDFWVDPAEDLLGILMAARLPGAYRPAEVFRVLVYQALDD